MTWLWRLPIQQQISSCLDVIIAYFYETVCWHHTNTYPRLHILPCTSMYELLTTHHHIRFTALFPGPPGWAGARRELLDFMVQGEIHRCRHTNPPAGRHSIRTNQCPPPPSPHIFLRAGCPSCRPTNSVKALKALHHCLCFCHYFPGEPGLAGFLLVPFICLF